MALPLIQMVQIRTARVAIGPSTARNMGPTGTIEAAQIFLGRLDMGGFAAAGHDAREFGIYLEQETANLQQALPAGGQHWGSSRKFLNIFLRDALYNHHLRTHYRLERIERYLEVPLDGNVANRLRAEPEGLGLPGWRGVIHLDHATSDLYQGVAAAVARRLAMTVVDLDLLYW